jgi:60 kDa SS-A/Ro ribonucleoprotein
MFTPLAPKYSAPTTVNRDGYGAWERPIEEQFLQTLLTNTLTNVYYADARELLKESEGVHDAMLAKDANFYAKALVFARNEGFMRTQPILGLAKLASANISLFSKVFGGVVKTPKDLADFTTILASKRKGQGGRAVKRVVGRWMVENLSDYWIVKYGAEKEDGGYSLKDMLRVFHPKGLKEAYAKYILGKTEGLDYEEIPQIYNFEKLKSAKTPAEKIQFIREGKLPHEVASTFAGKDKEVWSAINFPMFALLRNLATLERNGAIDSFKEQIQRNFNNPDYVKKSKILPFRFIKAGEMVKNAWVKDALRDAIENSVDNLPDIAGSSTILLDISGSMRSFLPQAALFAVSAAKKANEDKIYLFDTGVYDYPISMRDSILTQAEGIRIKGGTDIGYAVRSLISKNVKRDNVIIITDEQQNTGSPMFKEIINYKRQVNKNANFFIIDVAPYRQGMTPPELDKGTYYIYGWSDQVLSFISSVSQGFNTQVEAVRTYVA